jgi:hypothetical protein
MVTKQKHRWHVWDSYPWVSLDWTSGSLINNSYPPMVTWFHSSLKGLNEICFLQCWPCHSSHMTLTGKERRVHRGRQQVGRGLLFLAWAHTRGGCPRAAWEYGVRPSGSRHMVWSSAWENTAGLVGVDYRTTALWLTLGPACTGARRRCAWLWNCLAATKAVKVNGSFGLISPAAFIMK